MLKVAAFMMAGFITFMITAGQSSAQKDPAKRKSGDISKLISDAQKIVERNQGEDPDDYCAFESNYIYLALSLLTEAVNADHAKATVVLDATDAIQSPSFDKFRVLPEFKKWRYSLEPLPKTAPELLKFIIAHNEWLSQETGAPPGFVTFEGKGKVKLESTSGPAKAPIVASWKAVSGSKIEISPKRLFELKVENHFFDFGKKSFRYLALAEIGGTEEVWTMGPITGDCN